MSKKIIFPIATLLLFCAVAPLAFAQSSSGGYDFKAASLADVKDLQNKFIALAQVFPQDKYTWRPGTGIPSVSESFLHVSAGNFFLPTSLGVKPYPGYAYKGYETSTTDKDKIIEQLMTSFAYEIAAIQGTSSADLLKATKLLGSDTTGNGVLFRISQDMHESLSQLVTYARMNNVVPPWMAPAPAAAKP